jgi:superfamily II DNA or RNA helicase
MALRTGISSRGYSVRKEDLDLKKLEQLKDELTVAAFVPMDTNMRPPPFKLYMESDAKIYIPKAYGLRRFGIPLTSKMIGGEYINVEFVGSLRAEQAEPVNKFIEAARDPVRGGGVISLPCGGGKTILAIYIMCVLKKKTIIVVHKDFLLQQWKERIEQFAPSARVGILKAQKLEIDDKDIVMASLQSLSMKDYSEKLFDSFGFSIYDECFPYDQLVLTESGPLEIGRLYTLWDTNGSMPRVLSYNEKTRVYKVSKVTFAWKKPYEGELIKIEFMTTQSPYVYASELRCTSDHKMITPDGQVPAKEMKEGDLVVSTGGVSRVYKITRAKFSGYVYDIEVRGDHTFMVCGPKGRGATAVSNCHHLSAEVFSQALKKVNTQYSLGLSATPKRKDGLTKVFLWHLGDIVYSITKRTDTVDVRMIEYFESDPVYGQEQYMFRGKLNTARMINNICDFVPRIDFVVGLIKEVLEDEPGRRFLVLSDRRSHVDAMVDKLRGLGIEAAQYYGGMKTEALKAAEDKTVICSTWAQASEGLDLRGLNTLVLASPKTDVIQASGRILRDKPEERLYTPLIIDIVDKYSIFVNQAKKRAAYYKKCKYNVTDQDVFVDTRKIDLPGRCLIVNTEPCNE